MAALTPVPKIQFFDANGNPLAGGKLYSYDAGTTTPRPTYTNYGGATPNANPVILDSRGEANVWLDSSLYKFKLTSATDVEIWTVDNVDAGVTLAQLAASGGSALIGFLQAGTGAVTRTAQSKMREIVSMDDFGAIGNGITDDSSSLSAAGTAAVGRTLFWPAGTYKVSNNVTFGSTVTHYFDNGAIVSIDSGKTVTFNGRVVALYGTPYSGAGTATFNNDTNIFCNDDGFAVGPVPSIGSDDFIHFQRDINTSSGILIINDDLGALAEGFIHIWGGPRSGGSTGSGIRMSANSLAGGALVDIVAHTNLGFAIIQQSNAPIDFYTNNAKVLSLANAASVVNYWEFIGAATGSSIQVKARGANTDVNICYDTKGAGSHFFRTNDGSVFQFEVQHVASATRRIYVKGSNGGNPIIGVSGGALRLGESVDIQWGIGLVNLGGGAAPTLGTIGGLGPTTAAQNSWMRVLDAGGAPFWVPVWK